MRIAAAQIDPVVGAFAENAEKIRQAYRDACSRGARVLLTPELGICGYPPHDLVDRPEMFERNEKAIQELAKETKGKSCALIVGHIVANPRPGGRKAQNVVSVFENGVEVFRQAKTLLPTYDVFDEARYFEPAEEIKLWSCDGKKIALAVCEDLWGNDPDLGRRLYGKDPVQCYLDQGAELLISISASPYVWAKRERREMLHAEIAKKLKVPLIYVNQVGGTDEILFDGESFAVDSTGKFLGRFPYFKNAFAVFDLEKLKWEPGSDVNTFPNIAEMDILARGLVTGIRDYFQRTGFKTAMIGLSGGIDSGVVAVLAAKALGAENVMGIAMPSQYSAAQSLEDAETLAKNLGIRLLVKPIKFMFSTVTREIAGSDKLADIALENLQSRLRAVTLMTLSNHYNSLVLTTGNKSELATGYCTIYGDMVGALAPIGDLFKTRVYEFANHMNQIWGGPIPESMISRPPTAELKPNQKDSDSLPPYSQLDALLEDYIERGMTIESLRKKHAIRGDSKWVEDTIGLIERNEFKRRQASPVLKVGNKAFGIGRRVPVAKKWGVH